MNKYPMYATWLNRLLLAILLAIIAGCDVTVEDTHSKIILEISDVRLSILESQPPQLVITVAGNVSTPGWAAATLVPVEYVSPPEDGIYEFSFYATPPVKPEAPDITPIEVTHRLNPLPDNLKGVRIYAETNDIVRMLTAPPPAPVPSVISEITDARLSFVDSQTGRVEIFAKGIVPSTGWSNPTLVAAEYITPPQDGIYDYTFYATPPEEVSLPVTTPIEVTHRLNTAPENFRGVRIHSQTNEFIVSLDSQKPPPSPVAISEITAVSLSVLKTLPPKLVIDVTGTVDSAGWTQPTLVPHEYLVPPRDGIYEFTFMAMPPLESSDPNVASIELTHTMESIPDNLLGVRIYSASNNIEALLVMEIPKSDPAIINEITDVKLSVLESLPRQLNITAMGNVTSSGWSSPVLVPFQYVAPPQDGIYDFTFYATPPSEPGVAVLTPIEVSHRLSVMPENLNGVRIHSETNAIEVRLDVQKPPLVPSIIYSINAVQISPVTAMPGQADIRVEGTVISGGWTKPMLIAHEYVVPPRDGIYDFTFYATPSDGQATDVLAPIEVVHRLNAVPSGMRGVRIHATTNNVEAFLVQDPTQADCEYVQNKTFETAELYEGGFGPPGVDTRIHWRLSFADGTFLHEYSDVAEMGTYYCDDTGFHLINSIGSPYVPWDVNVDIVDQSVNIPVSANEPRYYFLVDPLKIP